MINANNVVFLSGGLTKDPEYKEEFGLVTFSLAVDGAGRENGESASGFFDVSVWTKPNKYTPEAVGEYVLARLKDGSLAKGSRIEVVARLEQQRWENKEGTKQYRVGLVAENVMVRWSKVQADKKAASSASGSSTNEVSNAPSGSDEPSYEPTPF